MEWWEKALLVIAGVVPSIVAFVFSIYACIRVGARSERHDENKDDPQK